MANVTGTDTGTPLYESLADRLRQSIKGGEYKPGQLLGSEHELARQIKISRMTVRRASELLVQEGLLERRPGKGLYVRDGHVMTRTVQVIAGNLEWASSLQVSRGVQALAREKGIQVQLYDAHGDVELDLDMLRRLPESGVDGAVIVSLHGPAFTEAIYQLKLRGFPFVLVDQRLKDIEVPSVTADNYGGGYAAARALIEQGHRRIAFIGDLIASTVQARLAGMRDAIADAGAPFDRSLVVDLEQDWDRFGDWSEPIERATRQVMGRETPPTAIFYSCDGVAWPGCVALRRMGLRVPEDVSVVGFDDDPVAQFMSPALTTVRQPFAEIGKAAIKLLCRRFEDPKAPVEHSVIDVECVHRGSIGPPRSAG